MKQTGRGQVRIIAGLWRGRRLHFPNKGPCRPTPDRVRETLFNWLSPVIVGARCLDCYAGSGALGFEALSRGAQSVVAIEACRAVATALRENAETLGIGGEMTIINDRFPKVLPVEQMSEPFDIVFLDPPFSQNKIDKACRWLEENKYLSDDAWIYMEMEKKFDPEPPPAWHCYRQTVCGEGKAMLFKRHKEENE